MCVERPGLERSKMVPVRARKDKGGEIAYLVMPRVTPALCELNVGILRC